MVNKVTEIVDLLSESYATDVSGFDRSFIEKSIERRLAIHKDLKISDYITLLKNKPDEGNLLIESLHISFSEFFRNPLTFAYIEQFVLPLLWNQKLKGNNSEIRIWSAACASGQEAYSIAILLDELNLQSSKKIKYRIFATDNNASELEKAKIGEFDSGTMQKVSLRRVQNYFNLHNEHYSISPAIKQQVDFSLFDLLADQPASPAPSIYGNFDLVICCNLLFYYMPVSRRWILEKISKTMTPGAFLVTGETERDILVKNGYLEYFENSAIFQKKTRN